MRWRSGHGRSRRGHSGRGRSNWRGPPPQGCAVRQHDGHFQTAKAEETADRYRYPQGIVGQPGRQQQRNIVLPQKLVALQAAPAADIGIDRYLQRFAGSTLPANQVNDGAAALAADEPGGFGGYFQVSGHRAPTVEWGINFMPAPNCARSQPALPGIQFRFRPNPQSAPPFRPRQPSRF